MPPTIIRSVGLEGAFAASGPTVVIDTYRAFSTAAELFEAGIMRLIVTDGIDEARRIAAIERDALLCGEDGGRRPDDFDLGNSPTEVMAHPNLAGATVIMRTTAGTRCVVAAIAAGARPVYAASLLIARATAEALAEEQTVTLVSSGGSPAVPHDEDQLTGDVIAGTLLGRELDANAVIAAVLAGTGTRRLRAASWIDDGDIERCLMVDALDFAMRVNDFDDLVTLSRH